ncbi:hypothetical protein BDN72DRAFT_606556 [Pluteus cervinus]|uniref:Uncharacterized protein n=1 Tax=Pluteus cervinus TaxID=181527 RepID=A0ACD3BBL5_9AGAR|nr:hypothetical protein BDN72DRAFT_606556 [Pluteus cervinus]
MVLQRRESKGLPCNNEQWRGQTEENDGNSDKDHGGNDNDVDTRGKSRDRPAAGDRLTRSRPD